MSPFTIDRARSDFYKYANRLNESAVVELGSSKRRIQKIRALFWLYFDARRLENHLYVRERLALQTLAFTTLKEARQAIVSLSPRDPLEAALVKAVLKLKSVHDINEILPSLEAIETYRQDADREGVLRRNRSIGPKGGRPPDLLSKVVHEIVKQDHTLTIEEFWERLAAKAGGSIVISVTDDDVEVYKQDGSSEIVSRTAIAKRLTEAKKAFTKTKKQHSF